jgi:hypothetical protein
MILLFPWINLASSFFLRDTRFIWGNSKTYEKKVNFINLDLDLIYLNFILLILILFILLFVPIMCWLSRMMCSDIHNHVCVSRSYDKRGHSRHMEIG